MLEISFTEQSKCDAKSRLTQPIDVLSIDAVIGLPLDINKSWIAHNDIIVSQFKVDGLLFAEISLHGCLGILRGAVD